MSDLASQLTSYKHLLKLSEDLLNYAGIPEELRKKYDLIKDKTLEKVRSSSYLSDSTRTASSSRIGIDSLITEEFSYFFDMLYTSNNTLCDKIVSLLNYLTNLTTRSGIADSQRTVYGAGLINENKNQFFAKIKSLKDSGSDPAKYSDFKQNIDYFLNNQVPRFEKLENRLLKYITGIEDHILRQNEKVLEMEDLIDGLQRSEQKLKLELDMLSSKINDTRQIQSIENMERSHDLQSQVQHLKESLRKAEHSHDRQVNEMKNYYEGVISELQEKMQSAERSFSKRIDDMYEKERSRNQVARESESKSKESEYFHKLTETIRTEFKPFYDKYISTHNKSFDSKQGNRKNKDDMFDLVYFAVHLLQKFENDNLWLVDKLTDMGNENEDLRNRLQNDKGAKEQFDKLFKKLRGELQDSKAAFFDWDNSIQDLKKCVENEKDALRASELV